MGFYHYDMVRNAPEPLKSSRINETRMGITGYVLAYCPSEAVTLKLMDFNLGLLPRQPQFVEFRLNQ